MNHTISTRIYQHLFHYMSIDNIYNRRFVWLSHGDSFSELSDSRVCGIKSVKSFCILKPNISPFTNNTTFPRLSSLPVCITIFWHPGRSRSESLELLNPSPTSDKVEGKKQKHSHEIYEAERGTKSNWTINCHNLNGNIMSICICGNNLN